MTSPWKNSRLLQHACEQGNVRQVKRLADGFKDTLQRIYAVDRAAQKGHVEIVQYLLPLCNTKEIEGVLISACVQGHTHVVACLVKAQALEHYNSPLQWAAKYEHSKIVDILIPLSAPKRTTVWRCDGPCNTDTQRWSNN